MGLNRGVGRLPGGFGGEVLGHIGLGTARLVGIKQLAGTPAHQIGGLGLDVAFSDRELHTLVLPDRAVKHTALARVARAPVDEPAGVADAFGGNQCALGVQAIEDVLKAFAILTNQVVHRDLQILEEKLTGLVVDHVADGLDRQPLANGLMQVNDED